MPEVFAGVMLWVFFGSTVPTEDIPMVIWPIIAAIGLAVGVFGKWRLSEEDKCEDNRGKEPWYSVLWRYDMYGNKVPPLFLVIVTHAFAISGGFYVMVSISLLWQ